VRRVKGEPKTVQAGSNVAAGDPQVLAQLQRARDTLEDHKAVEVTVIPLAGQASFADYLVIASGTSTRHVISMGQALRERMGREIIGVEGLHEGEWVCADMGAVVVHVFLPEKRRLYNLEKLWSHVFDVADEQA